VPTTRLAKFFELLTRSVALAGTEIPTQKPRAIWLFLHEPLELTQVQKC